MRVPFVFTSCYRTLPSCGKLAALLYTSGRPHRLSAEARIQLLDLRELIEHLARDNTNLRAVVARRDVMQHFAHAGVGLYRLEHTDGLGAHFGVGIFHKRFQHGVTDAHIIGDVGLQPLERLEAHGDAFVISKSDQ